MNIEVANFILQAIGIGITLTITFWKFTDVINKKFEHNQKNQNTTFQLQAELQKKTVDRIYERMDERQEEIDTKFLRHEDAVNKTFVRLDVHNITIQHLEEKTSEKFKTTIEKFELTIANLTKAIGDLVKKMEEK